MVTVIGHLNESSTSNCSSEGVPIEKYQVTELPRGMKLFQEARESLQFIEEHIRTTFKNGMWKLPMLGSSCIRKVSETVTH